MDHSLDCKNGIAMCGRVRGFEDTSLIDPDINHDRSRLHMGQHFAGDKARSLGTGDEHSANDQICRAKGFQ